MFPIRSPAVFTVCSYHKKWLTPSVEIKGNTPSVEMSVKTPTRELFTPPAKFGKLLPPIGMKEYKMTNELLCLAAAIFFEARGEPHTGQELVAEVVMNRVEHERFPDTVCGVVYDDKQFSFTHDGLSDDLKDYPLPEDRRMAGKALILAQNYLDGYRLGSTSTHYHADYVEPFWVDHFEVDGVFGSHIFYTCGGFC